jgi:hypothetical protein
MASMFDWLKQPALGGTIPGAGGTAAGLLSNWRSALPQFSGATGALGATVGLPALYTGAAMGLQKSLPDELKGEGGIYDRIGYPGAMSAGAGIEPDVDEVLRANAIFSGNKNVPVEETVTPPGVFPESENLIPPFMDEPSGLGEGSDRTRGFNFSGIPSALANMLNYRNPLSERSSNYNPRLAGQIQDLRNIDYKDQFGKDQTGSWLGTQSSPYQITGGPLAGQNLVSGFGTNDYDEMLAKKREWFEKRGEGRRSKNRYKALLDEMAFRAGEREAPATRTAPRHSGDISRGPGGGGGGGHQAANIRSISSEGPGVTASSGMHGGRHYAYGGRVGYNKGGRVGILSIF